MSEKIGVLAESLTNRIAAGEVVERPASIVKELLENALDAGATEIAVELAKGGSSLRLTDNGEGIAGEDVPRAFARYATSKIGRFEDIYQVHTFGFRGEALPSIASIARVEMMTRQAASPAGTRVVVENGKIMEMTDIGCPVGTSILVNRIFEAVPVRRKFLKSELTEQGYCMDAITRLALLQPTVKFRVAVGGRGVLHIPSVPDLAERIALTLGRDFSSQMVAAASEGDGARVRGYVSRPEFTRSSAAQIYLYVNKRFVKDYLLNHAVMTAYRRVIEARRYPAIVLELEIAPEDVDVNVHPAKMEVRFRAPRAVYALVVDAVGKALGAGLGNVVSAGASLGGDPPGYASRVEEALKRYRIASGPEKLSFPDLTAGPGKAPAPVPSTRREAPAESEPAPERPRFSDLRFLGQIGGAYLIFAGEAGLVLVDQHAAHERILFEKLRRQATGEKGIGQRLLLPEVVSLPPGDIAFLKGAIPILEDAGLEVEPFGGDSVVIKAVPALLSHTEARTLLLDLLGDCSETDRSLPLQEKRERIFTSLACRGAVKADRDLAIPEVAALCRELDALASAATCPHGRPLALSITVAELEKMFKRR